MQSYIDFRCIDCYYCHAVKDKEDNLTGVNECRLDPPGVYALSSIANATLYSAWPLIDNPKDGWCGQGIKK